MQRYLEEKIEGWMGLELNRDKTKVVELGDGKVSLDFLGYTFRYDRDQYGRGTRYLNIFPSDKALKRERAAIREKTGASQNYKPVRKLIGELNRHLRGWQAYFGKVIGDN